MRYASFVAMFVAALLSYPAYGLYGVVWEDPVPVKFTIPRGTHYRLHFPTDKVEVYSDPKAVYRYNWYTWLLYSDTDPSFTVDSYVVGDGLPGDANGDGRVALDDLVTIRNNFWQSASASDVNKDGYVNDDDLIACRNLLDIGGDSLTVYVFCIAPSTALNDVQIDLLTDPDSDGSFTIDSTQTMTSVAVNYTTFPGNPNGVDYAVGPPGAAVTLTIQPAIAPLVFDGNTTARFIGVTFAWDHFFERYMAPVSCPP